MCGPTERISNHSPDSIVVPCDSRSDSTMASGAGAGDLGDSSTALSRLRKLRSMGSSGDRSGAGAGDFDFGATKVSWVTKCFPLI